MDIEKTTTQMKTLYQKARAARKEGQAAAAKMFKAGAQRLERKLKAAQLKRRERKKGA